MAKSNSSNHKAVVKTTAQNGSKTSNMNKTQKRSYKAYRGQGR